MLLSRESVAQALLARPCWNRLQDILQTAGILEEAWGSHGDSQLFHLPSMCNLCNWGCFTNLHTRQDGMHSDHHEIEAWTLSIGAISCPMLKGPPSTSPFMTVAEFPKRLTLVRSQGDSSGAHTTVSLCLNNRQ